MRSVEIECKMLAVCGEQTVTLTASGKTGVMSCPDVRNRRDVLRALPVLLKHKRLVQAFHKHCVTQQMSLCVELRERAVLQIGHGAKPGMFSRLLGIYPVEIRATPLCIALLECARRGR